MFPPPTYPLAKALGAFRPTSGISLQAIDREPPAAAQSACQTLMPPLGAIALIFGSDGSIGLSSFSPVQGTTNIPSSALGPGLPYDLDCFYTGKGARLHFVFIEGNYLSAHIGPLIDQDGGNVTITGLGPC